tara:strand:+ start:795 stop:2381 length:1587 start_codon:yes stop_codon:yes gene_type:complete
MASKELEELLKDVKETPIEKTGESQNIRTFAQGLSFGFADEIEAFVRSAVDSNASYADTLKEVRNKINRFRRDNPVAAYGTEIAGAILPSIAAAFIPGGQAVAASTVGKVGQAAKALGLGKKGQTVTKSAAVGAGGSGLYGFGTGEGLEDSIKSAGTSAAIGAVANPAIQAVAPRITQSAKKLLDRGVELSPGQAVGDSGLIGRSLKTLEEKVSGNVFLIGDAVESALQRSQKGFNRAAVEEALEDIAVKVPKNLEGRRLIGFGQSTLKSQYAKTLGKMKLTDEAAMNSEISKLTNDLSDEIKKDITDRASRYITKKFVDGQMSGQNIKRAETLLRRDIQRLQRSGAELDAQKADALLDIKSVFSNELQKANPKQAPILNNIDKSYGKFEIVRNASIRRKLSEDFTPGDLLQASAKSDTTKRQSKFSAGDARMQNFAQNAQNIIGNTVPNSGTAGRFDANRMITGSGGLYGATLVDPVYTGSALASPILYSQLGVPVTRALVSGAGRAMQSAVPVTSQMLAQQLMNGT